MTMPPLQTSAHIAEILTCLFAAAGFIASGATVYVLSRLRAWFYEWLVKYNTELDERFVSQKVYDVEHPHRQNSAVARRHAQ
jgi:hypothetical protein